MLIKLRREECTRCELKPTNFEPDKSIQFCLVPPLYQRNWINDGAPEYIYTSHELDEITRRLFLFLHELLEFKFRHLPDPQRPYGRGH